MASRLTKELLDLHPWLSKVLDTSLPSALQHRRQHVAEAMEPRGAVQDATPDLDWDHLNGMRVQYDRLNNVADRTSFTYRLQGGLTSMQSTGLHFKYSEDLLVQ